MDVYETLNARIGLPPQPEGMRAAAHAAGIPGIGTSAGETRIIHIAGTNGKGSTAAMLDSMLRVAGYKTGLFTSPHLLRFTERIRVNGKEIAEEALPALLEEALRAERESGARLNYFALVTLMALLSFKQAGCSCCILEAGLGGRLDPTNCIDAPMLAILTRIGVDHTTVLGSTLRKIAMEKAGILKPGCDVVLTPQTPEVTDWIRQRCAELGVRLHEAQALVPARDNEACWQGILLTPGLQGAYQAENAGTALEAVRVLREKGMRIPNAAVQEGMRTACWPGRFQWINAYTLADGAHNPQGALALRRSLEDARPGARCIFVMGVMEDKPYVEMTAALAPLARAMIAVPAGQTKRSLPETKLQTAMRQCCREVYAAPSLQKGLALAEKLRGAEDLIVICGSLYLVAELV